MSESILGSATGEAAPSAPATGNPAPVETKSAPAAPASNPSWRDSLPDDIKANASLSSFSDVPNLAKAYINAQGLIGKKGVIPPTEHSTAEDWNNFYKAVGLPDKDKYSVNKPEKSEFNDEFVAKFKETAHQAGVLPKQAQAIMDMYAQHESAQSAADMAEVATEQASQIAALKQEWGPGFDKNVKLAQLAVRNIGGESFEKYLNETGLGNDVQLIKFMTALGGKLGEDKLVGGGTSHDFGQTPAEMKAEMDQIQRSEAYRSARHVDHKAKIARMEQLGKAMWPEKDS